MATMTIWHGAQTPLKAVGKHQTRLLGFLEKHKGWHSMGTDKATTRAVEGLLRRGCIAYNPSTNQVCIVYSQGTKL